MGAYLLPLPRLQLVHLATSPYLPTRALLAMRTCFAIVVGMSLRSSLADPEPVRFNLITYAGTLPTYLPYLVRASTISPVRARGDH